MAVVLTIRDNTMVPTLAVTRLRNSLAIGPVFGSRPNVGVASSRVIVGDTATRSWSVVDGVWPFAVTASTTGTARGKHCYGHHYQTENVYLRQAISRFLHIECSPPYQIRR